MTGGIYNYGIVFNVLLIMVATLVMTCGISFFVRAKNAGWTKAYVLFYGITAALWCGAYGIIGLCPSEATFYKLRVLGIFGVNGLLVVDYFMATEYSGLKGVWRHVTRLLLGIYSLADVIIFSSPEVDTFKQIGNWTTWMGNSCWQRDFHLVYITIAFLILFGNALMWMKREKLMRRRQLMRLLVIGNFSMIFFSIPDTFFVMFHRPALPTSGFGGALCALVIWFGACRLDAFQISLLNAIESIYSNINVGILVYDTDMRLAMANPYACKKLGVREGEFVGRSVSEIYDDSGEEKKKQMEDHLEEVKQKGEGQISLSSPDDQYRFQVKTSIALDDYKEPFCYISALYDVTEMERVMEELKIADQAKSDFLASMSHEIRTPINAVLGLDEMILRESNEKIIRSYAADIRGAGKSLLSIINDILDFSKIESGKLEIVLANYQISSLINDCYNMVATKARDKGLELKVVNEEDLPTEFYGDEIRIRQIMVNLLTNAIKYTQEGSVTFRIGKATGENGEFALEFEVVDTGMGIKEENIPMLFDSFKRMDETKNRHIEGTGLGLSITKKLTERMRGSIWVESEYGKGSVFRVGIPQKVVDSTPIGNIYEEYVKKETDDTVEKVSFRAPQAKVLVVDDVLMNLVVFEGLLKQTEVGIDKAFSGKEALQLVQDKTYDIIFMDHMMPEMDGIETLGHMREDKQNRNQKTPVVALTANAVAGAKEMYLEVGFEDYLTKPIEIHKLEKMMIKLLPEELIEACGGEAEEVEKQPLRTDSDVPEDCPEDSYKSSQEGAKSNHSLQEEFSFLDIQTGLSYCMNDESFYREMIRVYVSEDKSIDLDQMLAEENFTDYQIKVHALKSNSLNIGAVEVSAKAKELEFACKDGNYDFVKEKHSEVMKLYRELMRELDK